jgi:hypothetical protein
MEVFMFSHKIGFLVLATLMCVAMHGASFTVHNQGSNTIGVSPQWSDRCNGYDTIEPGGLKEYVSGFNKVDTIRWYEKLPSTAATQMCPGITMKMYEGDSNIGGLNILGHFKIFNGGSYRREFGVDGTNDGNGRPRDTL